MHRLVTVLRGFLAVESQAAVVALVEVPVARDRDPQPIVALSARLSVLIARFWTLVKETVGSTFLARINSPASRAGFVFGKVDVPPAGRWRGSTRSTVAMEISLLIFSRFPCRSGLTAPRIREKAVSTAQRDVSGLKPVCVRSGIYAPDPCAVAGSREASPQGVLRGSSVGLAVHGASRQFCGLVKRRLCAASAISARLHPSGLQGGTVLL